MILTGEVARRTYDTGLRAGIGAVGGIYASPYRGAGYRPVYSGGGHYSYGAYYSPWGFSYYGGRFSFSIGWGGGWRYPCYSYWWPCYVSAWYPLWYSYYRPYYAYPAYSTVIYETVVQQQAAEEPAEEEEPALPRARVAGGLTVAAERYLTLGDRAFREGNYTHAVQFYAKAVELAPDEGALYLVMADALFAAGDYHYGAYAVRRALELDATLVDEPIDKHDFYASPEDFDAQLIALEEYVREHPSDRDARLMLALNFYMGARVESCVELLESPASLALAGDPAAERILEVARTAATVAKAAVDQVGSTPKPREVETPEPENE